MGENIPKISDKIKKIYLEQKEDKARKMKSLEKDYDKNESLGKMVSRLSKKKETEIKGEINGN
jgi:hypothetical protein